MSSGERRDVEGPSFFSSIVMLFCLCRTPKALDAYETGSRILLPSATDVEGLFVISGMATA